MLNLLPELSAQLDVPAGKIVGGTRVRRYLSDLDGYFVDTAAYAAARAEGDSVVYTVSSVKPADGEGQLHYGLGTINPGRIGAEYYMTKGHLHTWRCAAEVYVGLRGDGAMLLEDEKMGDSQLLPLRPDRIVYVPGHTAHRTINVGEEPLVYLGIYPAEAGHDYAFIAERNFQQVVIEQDGRPTVMDREAYLRSRS